MGHFPPGIILSTGLYAPGPGVTLYLAPVPAKVLSLCPIVYFLASDPKSLRILYFPGPGIFLSNILLVS